MTTMQKFKLLASQCGVVSSPTRRTNGAGAGFELRRRKSLRQLLTRAGIHRRGQSLESSPECQKTTVDPTEQKAYLRHTLKDLFVSSPPPIEEEKVFNREKGGDIGVMLSPRSNSVRAGTGRKVTGMFRYRVLRRAWRPGLVTIPE